MQHRHGAFCPDFFLLGAAKAGTTSLHYWLSQHPGICMSEPKEPFFFEAEYERGLEYYRNKYFRHCEGKRLLGDARHRNLYLSYVPARIHASCPDAKFIAVLRDPVERAYSHWWHWYRLGEEQLPFREAIVADAQRIAAGRGVSTPDEIAAYVRGIGASGRGPHRTYLDSGYYAEQLERYFRLFPRDRFRIVLFERMIAGPAAICHDVCRLLGIDDGARVRIDFSMKNSHGRLRWRFARTAIAARFADASRTDPAWLFSGARWKQLLARPPMEAETREWLRAHYRPHNARLAELLGIDLSAWGVSRD